MIIQKAMELEVTKFPGRERYERAEADSKLRPEDKRAVAVLCAYGMLWNGKKVLLHLALGDKESTSCWEAFIEDMKQRGLPDPLLCVVDGCAGVRKAIGRKYCNSLVQRCQVHKMRNIMNKLPHVARAQMHKLIQRAFTAARYEEGLAQARALIDQYKDGCFYRKMRT